MILQNLITIGFQFIWIIRLKVLLLLNSVFFKVILLIPIFALNFSVIFFSAIHFSAIHSRLIWTVRHHYTPVLLLLVNLYSLICSREGSTYLVVIRNEGQQKGQRGVARKRSEGLRREAKDGIKDSDGGQQRSDC